MSITNAIVQGIVQGLTEFLPVSSSGHLSLVQYFTGQSGETGAFFAVLLHMGTLLAVFIAFYKTILGLVAEFLAMIGDIFKGRFSISHAKPRRRMIFLLIVSLVPMALTVLFKDWFSALSSDNSILVEGFCFLLTSFLLFVSDRCIKGRKNASNMNYRDAAVIGVVQAIAPLPGLSRSGSTISTGLILGLDRQFAVAFSFIMGIPAVLGANLLELKDAVGQGMDVSIGVLLIGMASALIFGLLAIKMVNWLVTSDKFKYFAWYTLILGILTVMVAVLDIFTGHAIQTMVASLFA